MTRIIVKLDVKSEHVVKPVHFEGLRRVGAPRDLSEKYYEQGADEIFYIDIVASLYQRSIWFDQIKSTAKSVIVPFAVGGGVRGIDDFARLFHVGADKVVVNTYALQQDPSIIDNAAKVFGSQSVVINIEAKKRNTCWMCYTDCGRIETDKNVLDWSREAENRGAGEILLQSVDMDGRRWGFDINLIGEVVSNVSIPVVAASGAGQIEDIKRMVEQCDPSGVSVASLLHYNECSISDIREVLKI